MAHVPTSVVLVAVMGFILIMVGGMSLVTHGPDAYRGLPLSFFGWVALIAFFAYVLGELAHFTALRKAGVRPEEIDYINAHGTSTPFNDKFETMALKTVFDEEAYKVPISSTKSMIGHLLGAAGAVEAAVCVMAIQTGSIPPTINLENPDPDCDLDYTPHMARRDKVRTAMSNSLGFGGHNTSLIFQAFES